MVARHMIGRGGKHGGQCAAQRDLQQVEPEADGTNENDEKMQARDRQPVETRRNIERGLRLAVGAMLHGYAQIWLYPS
jgi:hypothetical protein